MMSKEYEVTLNARQCGKSMRFENLKLKKELEDSKMECLSLRLDLDKALIRINELTSENRELRNRIRNSKNDLPFRNNLIGVDLGIGKDHICNVTLNGDHAVIWSEVVTNIEKELRRSGGIRNEFMR